ncbi:MAG: DNA helicase [Cryobacterium sp.]|nr:DNA helicase [Cryobacterium sp.]
MALSRRREKELKKLKRESAELWDEQREVIDRASRVVREASRQLANVGREEVAPRVKDAYETSVAATRHVADSARTRIARDVLPAVSGALGSALAVLEAAKDPRVRAVVSRVRDAGARANIVPAKQASAGPGRYILIGIGLVAAAGIAYAAWQTLRADDEVWVADTTDDEL